MEKGILEAAASARSMKNLYAMKRWQLPKVQIVHPSVTMSNAIGENIELLEHLVPCGSVMISCSKGITIKLRKCQIPFYTNL